MRADIFLVSPSYGRAYGGDRRRVKHGLPPLGLACINGMIKARGYRTRFVDLAFSDWTEADFVEHVKRDRPRFVGITSVTTQIMAAVRIAQAIKKAAGEVLTVLGGPHPSALPELTASYPGVDLVVSGEGEWPLLQLLQGERYERIPGLTWTDNTTPRSNPRGPLITNLDAMPLPDFAGLAIERYGHILNGAAMPVMAGRGCPYRCVFCSSEAVARRNARFLSPQRFVDHIEDLVHRYGVRDFDFSDETFVLKADRVEGICDEIMRRRLQINWVCQTRVNGIDSSIVRMMKRAGCSIMQLGIESGDQQILNMIGKKIEKAKVRQACRTIKQEGIRLNGFFILGLPHDTPETIRRTIDFANELPLDFAQFAMYVPLPGSAGWELALDGQVLKLYANDWDDFSRYTYPIVESEALSRERLKTLHAAALRAFYFRPRMLAKCLLEVNSRKRLKNLLDRVTAFAQITKAKRCPGEATPMSLVTRDQVGGLIGALGRTDHEDKLPQLKESGPTRQQDQEQIPKELALPVLAS